MKRTFGILLAIYGVVVLLMVSCAKAEEGKSKNTLAKTTIK